MANSLPPESSGTPSAPTNRGDQSSSAPGRGRRSGSRHQVRRRWRDGRVPGRRGRRQRLASIANDASQRLFRLPGSHTVLRSRANGGRPLALYLPAGADLSRPFELVLFFHNKGGTIDRLLDERSLAPGLRRQGREAPNTVFAFPQGGGRDQAHLWMSPDRGESYRDLLREIREGAGRLLGAAQIRLGRQVVKAHSGGGAALANAMEAGELFVDRLELYDAVLGPWVELFARWLGRTENETVEVAVVYSPHQQLSVRTFRRLMRGRRHLYIERARVGPSQVPGHYWLLPPYLPPARG